MDKQNDKEVKAKKVDTSTSEVANTKTIKKATTAKSSSSKAKATKTASKDKNVAEKKEKATKSKKIVVKPKIVEKKEVVENQPSVETTDTVVAKPVEAQQDAKVKATKADTKVSANGTATVQSIWKNKLFVGTVAVLSAIIIALAITLPLLPKIQRGSQEKPLSLGDYVIDIGTFDKNNYNEEATIEAYHTKYDGYSLDTQKVANSQADEMGDVFGSGGCTAVVGRTSSGGNLVGRNMDLSLSENSIITYEVDINKYKARGIAYVSSAMNPSLNYKEIMKNGINSQTAQGLALGGTDYLNEKGLYIETNMRHEEGPTGETYPSGLKKYASDCQGTNPGAKRLCTGNLPGYLATRAANVNEAVAIAKSLDLYTAKTASMSWPFCFILADAEGNSGLLEIAFNKVSFISYTSVLTFDNGPAYQANYFMTEAFYNQARYSLGIYRAQSALTGLSQVNTRDEMIEHMQNVYYDQYYLVAAGKINDLYQYVEGQEKAYSKFEIITELSGSLPMNHETKTFTDKTGVTYKYEVPTGIARTEDGKVDWSKLDSSPATSEDLVEATKDMTLYKDVLEAANEYYERYGYKQFNDDWTALRKACTPGEATYTEGFEYWVSAISTAVDCEAKVMTVRFWQDKHLTFTWAI